MTLIRQLREDAINSEKNLSDALRRAIVLASLIRNEELRVWAKYELDGYPRDVDIPPYRHVPVEIYGHFIGALGQQMSNYRVPVVALDVDQKVLRVLDRELRLRNGVQSIEEMVASADTNLKFSIPNEIALALWKQTHRSALKQVLDSVRNRLLEIALDLSEKFPAISESESALSDVDQTAAASIIHNHIYGSGNIVASGANVTQRVDQSSHVGDVTALTKTVEQAGVSAADAAELREAVAQDGIRNEKKLGPRVAAWFGRTSQKLLETGFTAAPVLLTEALSRYYGWK